MRRLNIGYSLVLVTMLGALFQSCVPRTEGPDNLNVITKPYSLHFADTFGLIQSTYDGERFDVLNATQGLPVEALWTSDKYILMKMANNSILFVDDAGAGSTNNFNSAYKTLNPNAFGQTMLINLIDYNDSGKKKMDRIYIASDAGTGVAYNDSAGEYGTTWYSVTDTALSGGKVTSYAKLDSKVVIAFDHVSRRVWAKTDLATEWHSRGGVGLPAAGTGPMFIISQKNDIYAVLINGASPTDRGVWRSTDEGNTFSKLPDLPNNIADITCAAAPFGKVLIVCTRDNGIWRFSGQGTWEYTFGLKTNTHVYGITSKSNLFKNQKAGEYVFVATSEGIYRSDDLGQNWVRLENVPGAERRFVAIH